MSTEATVGMWRIILQKYYDGLKWCIIKIDLRSLKDHDATTMEFHLQLVLRFSSEGFFSGS
jgi:hypothetical protein